MPRAWFWIYREKRHGGRAILSLWRRSEHRLVSLGLWCCFGSWNRRGHTAVSRALMIWHRQMWPWFSPSPFLRETGRAAVNPDLALWAVAKEAKNDRPRQNEEQEPSMAFSGAFTGLSLSSLGVFWNARWSSLVVASGCLRLAFFFSWMSLHLRL
jgi:hypothetical protein